jgi:hypothetical protein
MEWRKGYWSLIFSADDEPGGDLAGKMTSSPSAS